MLAQKRISLSCKRSSLKNGASHILTPYGTKSKTRTGVFGSLSQLWVLLFAALVNYILDRTLAVTPRKSKEMDPTEVEKICFDYTVNGLRTIAALANKPFRFVYTSGLLVERDQSKSLWFLAKYRRMRVGRSPQSTDVLYIY